MEIILIVLLVLVFLGLPMLQMKKQSRQIGEIRTFQSSLTPGMVVQLTSGLHGRIASVGEGTVDLEVSPGVVTTWDRGAVLKLVDTVEPGTAEADHLTAPRESGAGEQGATGTAGTAGTGNPFAGDDAFSTDNPGIPDDLSSLDDGADGADRGKKPGDDDRR